MDTPELEARFLQPEGWRWGSFNRNGRAIRFGSVMPEGGKPDAHVVCLPGLSEFGEKYFEIAHECLKKNFALWVIDWVGQGRSDRYFKHSQKRHSDGFGEDVADLHLLISEFIKPAAPLAMLAHSMGANIGLRYLEQHPRTFSCAGFSAPMWGLKVFEKMPEGVALTIAALANNLVSTAYAHGEGDWDREQRTVDGENALSKDPERVRVHTAWCDADAELINGGVTYGWIYQALLSCKILAKPEQLKNAKIPLVIGLAGEDRLVDNKKILRIAHILKDAETLTFPDARHEILMERDEVRGRFLNEFYKLVTENMNKAAGA
jgi:lysophospholipase